MKQVMWIVVCGVAVGFLFWADKTRSLNLKAAEVELREGPCSDQSTLLATTSGSPSYFTCPNRLHEMQVQVATTPSNAEAAALVFCKCRRGP